MREAFRFYERALNGEIEMMMTNGESPMADHMPPEQRDRVFGMATDHFRIPWMVNTEQVPGN